MTNRELWNKTGKRLKYKTPASQLWVEAEFRKRDEKIETVKKQNFRLTERINLVLMARKHYDEITAKKRAEKAAKYGKLWRRVEALWAEHERNAGRVDVNAVYGADARVAAAGGEPDMPVNLGDLPDAGRMNRF